MKIKAIVWCAGALLVVGLATTAAFIIVHERDLYEPAVEGGRPTMRLISAEQYISTVHYVFGAHIEVKERFPPLRRRDGLVSLGATTAVMTPGALGQFDRTARSVAMQVVDEVHRKTLVPCTPGSAGEPDDACAEKFFARVGRFLYRRPLTEAELETYIAMASGATQTAGDFYEGLAYSLVGMMMSPEFLFITETSEPDPQNPGKYRLDAHSKASRLSLFLWNALPDDALLTAANAGELHDGEGLARQVDRMLASPRLEHGVRTFFSDMLKLEESEGLSKDPIIYPAFTNSVARAAEEQTLRMIVDHLLVQQADYRDLFTSRRTFVNRATGPLHKAPVPGDGWMPYEFSDDDRAGLLTSLSFLARHSHAGRSSPTLRGLAIREIFLCQEVPDPPPSVNFADFEDSGGEVRTARERLDAHNTDPVCAGCHNLTDPIGLALENFDGGGQFRARENGVAIDTSGDFDGLPFTDVTSFGQAMSEHPALLPCLARKVYSYGIGREVARADRQWLDYIVGKFAEHEYRFSDLLREVATSDAFYAISVPDDDASHSKEAVADIAR